MIGRELTLAAGDLLRENALRRRDLRVEGGEEGASLSCRRSTLNTPSSRSLDLLLLRENGLPGLPCPELDERCS